MTGAKFLRWRVVVAVIAVAIGIALAENVGHIHSRMFSVVTRNPAAIAVTGYLVDYAPHSIYKFEQYLLLYCPDVPFYFLVGILSGLCLSRSLARYIVLWPITYAIWFTTKFAKLWLDDFDGDWITVLEAAAYYATYAPAYFVGLNLAAAVRMRRVPRWRLIDNFIAITIVGSFVFVIQREDHVLLGVTLLATLSWMAWRTWPNVVEQLPTHGLAGTE